MKSRQTSVAGPRLLILGASARSAAMSAARAGFQPICADLFADTDLREIAEVVKVGNYPDGLIIASGNIQPSDWMYVGALENYPTIVSRVSARHRLLGNPPATLREIRDPFRVTEFLRARGFPVLNVRTEDDPPSAGEWLRKPLRSAAGHGIRVEKPGFRKKPGFSPRTHSQSHPTSPAAHYFQQRGTGDPISATFIAFPERTELVGVTRQLIGVPEWNATTFGYCGSIGPLELPSAVNEIIEKLGNELTREFRLRGLFGLDLLCDGRDMRLTEINPRYTASVEILEWATGQTLVAEHAAACGVPCSTLPASNPVTNHSQPRVQSRRTETRIVGKAIVFAGREITVGHLTDKTRQDGLPQLADIPPVGTKIRTGEPICTVFDEGADIDDCRAKLDDRALEILRRIRD